MPKYSQAAIALLFGLQAVPVAPPAWADDCEGILKLSREVTITSADRSSVEKEASSFCNEYREAQSKGRSLNVSGSYKVISAAYGQQNVSASELATRYCSSDASASAKQDAYRSYIDKIAPGAFDAYMACKDKNRELRFSVSEGSVLAQQVTILATFVPKGAERLAEATYSASDDVSCAWEGSTESPATTARIAAGRSAALTCRRKERGEKSYIRLYRPDRDESLVELSWQPYDEQGNPLNVVRDLIARIEQLKASNDGLLDRVSSAEDRISKLTTSLTSKVSECIAPQGGGAANCNAECGNDQRLVSGSCTLLAGGGSIQNFGANGNGWHCLWGAGVVSGVSRGRAVAICATNK